MGVVVAHRAVHLGHQLDTGDFFAGIDQAHHHVGDFLADGGRAGGLAVGAAQHGLGRKGVGHLAHLGNHLVECGQQDQLAAAFELQRMAGVVDVLAGAGKVHKFTGALQFRPGFKFGLDPVLHGLDVVVGGFFNVLDGQCIVFREILDQAQQVSASSGAQRLEFGKTRIRQRDKPGDFNLHPAVHVTLLRHQRAQGGEFWGVPAV